MHNNTKNYKSNGYIKGGKIMCLLYYHIQKCMPLHVYLLKLLTLAKIMKLALSEDVHLGFENFLKFINNR